LEVQRSRITPDEVVSYTREDLLSALADELGSVADDPRILDAYDQIVSEWALTAEDPDAGTDPSLPGGTLMPWRTGPRCASCGCWPSGAEF
jgi:hypothetical protein